MAIAAAVRAAGAARCSFVLIADRFVVRFLARPFYDYAAAAQSLFAGGIRSWLLAIGAFVVSWFIYVPVHELMHAYGCIAAGGSVTRLEIAPEYGGTLLARAFPFVVSGSSYAGQLTGFDTHGSDAVYLTTVLAPYLLTILAGVPLLWHAARPLRSAWMRLLVFGAALPIAFAPFISITGDYYEAGSIVVTKLMHALDPSRAVGRWRSDDLFKLIGSLHAESATAFDWIVVAAGFAAGLVLALLTYHCGALVARLVTRRAPPSSTASEQGP
jgi:hypothetical protein